MPLIAFAVIAYATGLVAGLSGVGWWSAGTAAVLSLGALARNRNAVAGCLLIVASGAAVGADSAAARVEAGKAPYVEPRADTLDALGRWRARAGASIDTLFGDDAAVVRALLVADTHELPADVRDRYSRAGLVHVLSISGMHVGIISGAVLLALQGVRVAAPVARWLAVCITLLYVVAIGAPPPAVRSGVMFAATTGGWALQRHVSPWATLAIGAFIPLLLNPEVALDLGYQLSVAGYAALTAASLWARRTLPHHFRGFRRTVVTDLIVSVLATLVTAPLVAWAFGRISLVAPLTNLAAAPVVALMQPALFLALVLAPLGAPAQIAANGARPLVQALDWVAAAGSAVPGGSIVAAPSFTVALLGGVVAVGLVGAAASARHGRPFGVIATTAFVAMVWWPLVPLRATGLEVHMIDVGQGDAIALRTPLGRWIVIDAGGGRMSGDAGRRIVAPYLRRAGGEVALFIMTHPHDDHVGGAAAVITLLNPADVRDAAFAGTSPSYRDALVAAQERHVPWHRVRAGDSTNIDGVMVTYLAPDSAWTASLTDPNLASTVVMVRYGAVRVLLTGDAEVAEEEWMLRRWPGALAADALKVAHHGSSTSTRSAFLNAVNPAIALVSVGARNRYHHPSPPVMDSLVRRRIRIARTDQRGTVVLTTNADGTELFDGDRRLPLHSSLLQRGVRP